MTTTDFSNYDPEVPARCYRHPDTETYLRCGKCERPICARCRVSTPAGFRCPECANLQVLPTYAVDSTTYVRAAVGGLIAAAITGALMGIFPGFEFWAALLMGIAVPEVVSRSVNMKRGPGLRAVAMGCIVFGFVVSRMVIEAFPYLLPLGNANLPPASGIAFLNSLPFYVTQYTIVWLAMALLLAYGRLR